MRRLLHHRLLLRVFVATWLPFCCCQWQGAAVAFADESPTNTCGSGCCPREVAPASSSAEVPDDRPDAEDPCCIDCCIRGEVSLPAWELLVDRRGEGGMLLVAMPSPRGGSLASMRTHPPPDAGPPSTVPVAVHVRLQV